MSEGTIFGQVAMLYNNPRAATVAAKTDCKLYRVDRRTFRYFLESQQPQEKDDIMDELRRIDIAIDMISGLETRYSGSIIPQFRPDRLWLWRQWSGTVVQRAYRITLLNMAITAAIVFVMFQWADCTWTGWMAPDQTHPIISRMAVFGKTWEHMMTLTTFILTFFLAESYSSWRLMLTNARKMQSRLNDIGLLLATAASRKEDGQYTPEAERVLDDVARANRLFHLLFWANLVKSLGVLLTPRGMSRMLGRGLMTQSEFLVLLGDDKQRAPLTGEHHVCLEWMLVRSLSGMKEGGGIDGNVALSTALYGKVSDLRGTCEDIDVNRQDRMPLPYAHFVQILVDSLVATAPFALYPQMGLWSILSVGVVTLFYSGLLYLAKIFLDPLITTTSSAKM